MHAKWFNDEYKLDAMDEFISELIKMDDVYIVTVHQIVQWMQNPTTLKEIEPFSPWKTTCGKRRRLVMTRTPPPKPRLRATQKPSENEEFDQHDETAFRTRPRLQSGANGSPQSNRIDKNPTQSHNKEKTMDDQTKSVNYRREEENRQVRFHGSKTNEREDQVSKAGTSRNYFKTKQRGKFGRKG